MPLLRLGYKLPQFALDIAIADVFVLQHAIAVDGEGVRNRRHGEELCEGSTEAAVSILLPWHVIVTYEVFPLLLVRIKADAEYHEWLTFKLLRDTPNMWQRLAAWSTPGCPKINQHHFVA